MQIERSVKILLFLEVNTAQVLVLYDEFFKQNKNGEISKEKFLEERQVYILPKYYFGLS